MEEEFRRKSRGGELNAHTHSHLNIRAHAFTVAHLRPASEAARVHDQALELPEARRLRLQHGHCQVQRRHVHPVPTAPELPQGWQLGTQLGELAPIVQQIALHVQRFHLRKNGNGFKTPVGRKGERKESASIPRIILLHPRTTNTSSSNSAIASSQQSRTHSNH